MSSISNPDSARLHAGAGVPFDFAIIGGGVIGLSIAWELSHHGTVVLLDRNRVGLEASWAGAGILPPSSLSKAVHPIERLAAESFRLHESWSDRLKTETKISNGFQKRGALYVARTAGEAAALSGQILEWQENDVRVESLSVDQAIEQVPPLADQAANIRSAAFLPDEAQIKNRDHLAALKQACLISGVAILEEQGDCEFEFSRNQIVGLKTLANKTISAKRFCLTAGAWTGVLAEKIGVRISTLPVRGQMLMFKLPERSFDPIVYEGTRYIVPRDDGHVIVGSTLEEAGFDKTTTESGLNELKQFSRQLVPELTEDNLIDSWAGLRPASFDGFPYIGAAPRLSNCWIATAHFRSGLLLSTGTAKLVGQMMRDDPTSFDASPFRIDRG